MGGASPLAVLGCGAPAYEYPWVQEVGSPSTFPPSFAPFSAVLRPFHSLVHLTPRLPLPCSVPEEEGEEGEGEGEEEEGNLEE